MSSHQAQSNRLQCPGCGVPIEADARFSHFHVCPQCHSASVLDEKAARLSGKMAVLAQTPGPLHVGATGRIGKQVFRVLGRVRYGYEAGFWDEWFLQLGEDRTGWVSEDGDDFTLERHTDLPRSKLRYETIEPGQEIRIGRTRYHVDEKGVARLEGGEGELPFEITAGEEVPFLDLTSEETFATVEFEEGGGVRIFQGQVIDGRQIHVDIERSPGGGDTLAAERAADGSQRERVVQSSGRQLRIHCDGCGAALEAPETAEESFTCEYCSAVLDLRLERVECPECDRTIAIHDREGAAYLTCRHCRAQIQRGGGKVEILGILADSKRPRIPFELGQACRFEGHDFRLIGHLRFQERDGTTIYRTDEMLLWSSTAGYRWLVLENGHFTLAREFSGRPSVSRKAKPKHTFNYNERRWKVFESGRTELVWVDGQLPWVAEVGDRVEYLDAISPPYLLSREQTEREVEWSIARYLDREEVASAFGIDVEKVKRGLGVAPCQPYRVSAFVSRSAWLMLAFAIVQLFLVGWASSRGQQIASSTLTHGDYSGEYLTDPFTIEKPDRLCELVVSSPVDNSWVYLDFAVINSEEEVIHEFSQTVSYYHGVEGGESWSEGSRRRKVPFQIEKSGDYRLLVAGEAGTGESPASAGPSVILEIREGIVLKRYFILIAVFCAIWSVAVWGHRGAFESRRWADSDDDDD
jgi:ribosomal protein S27E